MVLTKEMAMNTILFGNGLNLLSNSDSWDELVNRITIEKNETKLPNTLQFEAHLCSMNHYKVESEKLLKKEICEKMKDYQSNEIYDRLANLQVSNFITTNYDFCFQSSLMKNGHVANGGSHIEKAYSLKRYVDFVDDNSNFKRIWYIHGELNRPNSIILGHKQYCDYTAKIVDYISKSCWNIDNMIEVKTDAQSWIDLFFCSNIYMIGFGLSYEEIDLWWLLSYRKRLQKLNPTICNNRIVYFGECKQGKKELLETLGIELLSSSQNEYIEKYNDYIDEIQIILKSEE